MRYYLLMINVPSLRYTLCFLRRGDEVLMLRRNKPPNQGSWNGVGGHIEPGELPRASVLREVREETGLRLTAVRFAGLLTWEGFEIESGGLYLFTARACPKAEPPDCNEGQLAWKPLDWVLSAPEVVSNIHRFGPAIFDDSRPEVHHFVYQQGHIVQYLPSALWEGLVVG